MSLRKRLNISQKILLPVTGGLLLAVLLLTAYNIYVQSTMVTAEEEQRLQIYYATFLEKLRDRGEIALGLATAIAGEPEVQRIFAAGDRQALLDTLSETYQTLVDRVEVYQAQFHLPPATSFLRMHKPEKFGDDLSAIRKTIVAVNQTRQPVTGLEGGAVGYGIRGVVPVIVDGEHIGAFEVGMAFDEQILHTFKDDYGAELAVFLYKDTREVEKIESGVPDLTLYGTTLESPFPLPRLYGRRYLKPVKLKPPRLSIMASCTR
jgi:methyl-accepting chemotaxis protein